ncbi:MAG: purine-nucleoside phosphorylase [Candidatus Sumerlaeaceae bacterium]
MSTAMPILAAEVEELSAVLSDKLAIAKDARALVIAGSGLGGFVRTVQPITTLSYAELPHVGASTVVGHAGNLIYGTVQFGNGPTQLLVMAGRRHLYEGITAHASTLLLRALLLAFPTLDTVIISNAAGGLNRSFEVGDLMLLSDHVNWTSRNPLLGPNNDEWGTRFPDLSNVYSRRLRDLAKAVALENGIQLREGVYIAGHGPSYETRAEVNMLRNIIGGDAVGMSTVPEALICAHMGREALGISFISNLLTEPAVTTHEEVMENARKVEEKFCRLLTALIPRVTS